MVRNEYLDVDEYFSGSNLVHMGDSIGPAIDEKTINGEFLGSAGTAGGIVELWDTTKNKKLGSYILTNYHCVRAGIPGFRTRKSQDKDIEEVTPDPGSLLASMFSLVVYSYRSEANLK